MKLSKDFARIKEIFPNVTFHRNSSGPGTLLNFHNGTYAMYVNKLYNGKSLDEFIECKAKNENHREI